MLERIGIGTQKPKLFEYFPKMYTKCLSNFYLKNWFFRRQYEYSRMNRNSKKTEKKKKLEKVKIEKQNESSGKSTQMSSKTLCLTVLMQTKIVVMFL